MANLPDAVRIFAPAKLNLFLHVERKRTDGFHDLQSLVAFADVGDSLTVAAANDFALTIDGPFADTLSGEPDNLVLRAARALAAHFGHDRGAHFTLTKNLPVASGIGGGSADAAAALRGLLALWNDRVANAEDVAAIAAGLGSDIPVCLLSCPAWMEGRGERVTPLPPLPDAGLVLVNPGISVATAEVFRRVVPDNGNSGLRPPGALTTLDALVRYLAATRNDLEEPARAIAPVIGEVLDVLLQQGALFVRMSGSGATCFGLFDSKASAQHAASAIAESRPRWWARACGFASVQAAQPVAVA